jgi:hypothetical protein
MTVTVTKEAGARTGGAGSYVLRITAYDTPDVYPPEAWAQHDLVLSAGVEYRIKGWLRSDPTNGFDPIVWTSRVDLGGADTEIVAPGGTTPWYEFDETFTPAHDSYLRFGGENGGAPAADFWFEFDDVELWATSSEPTDPILYWTAGNDAILDKDLVTVFEGEQSLSVTGQAGGDFELQDANLDERYSVDAFVMHDSGNGVIQSRVLDPEAPHD